MMMMIIIIIIKTIIKVIIIIIITMIMMMVIIIIILVRMTMLLMLLVDSALEYVDLALRNPSVDFGVKTPDSQVKGWLLIPLQNSVPNSSSCTLGP